MFVIFAFTFYFIMIIYVYGNDILQVKSQLFVDETGYLAFVYNSHLETLFIIETDFREFYQLIN